MTSPGPAILSVNASDITSEFIERLLRQDLDESLTLEYKSILNDKVVESIAALANTYGGLILVGISDTRKVVGIHPDCELDLVNMCHSILEPPVVPDMVLVTGVGAEELTVLAVRVEANRLPVPLVVRGRVPIRLPKRTAHANRQQLFTFFGPKPQGSTFGSGSGQPPSSLSPSVTYSPPGMNEEAFLTIRSAVRIGTNPASSPPIVDTSMRDSLQVLLNNSTISEWRQSRLRMVDRHLVPNWTVQGVNSSYQAGFVFERPAEDAHVPTFRAVLSFGQGVALFFLDAIFRQGDEAVILRVDELIELCTLMIHEVGSEIGVGLPLLQGIANTGLWMEGFTETRLDCSKSTFSDWVDFTRYQRLDDGRDLSQTNPLFLTGSALERGPIRPQTVDWIKRLMLDSGYTRFEDDLNRWRLEPTS